MISFTNNIYKHMMSIFKNVYIDKLDDMVNTYNDTYHRLIEMKPVDVKPMLLVIEEIVGKN